MRHSPITARPRPPLGALIAKWGVCFSKVDETASEIALPLQFCDTVLLALADGPVESGDHTTDSVLGCETVEDAPVGGEEAGFTGVLRRPRENLRLHCVR
jgi:hypothetical protein